MLRKIRVFFSPEQDTINALYPPEDKLNTWFVKDNERFRKALEQTGNKVTTTEPITGLVAYF